MIAFIIRRVLIAIVLLFVISLMQFFIITLTPGSPYPWGDLNPKISEQVKQNYRKQFHLDEPLHRQYTYLMGDLFKGTLVSAKDGRPVLTKIKERLPATLLLNATSLLFVYAFGIPWGIFAARWRGRWPDNLGTFFAFVLISMPSFWVAYLAAIWIVSDLGAPILGLQTFGVAFRSDWQSILDRVWHLMLPAIVLALAEIAVLSRYARATMIETLGEDYIRTARAKGLPTGTVMYKHAFRNSMRPIITGLGYLLPAMLGGSVIIESIFSYPGMGLLSYQAVLERDYPLLVSLNLVAAFLVLIGTLLADILYAVVDPRVRLE